MKVWCLVCKLDIVSFYWFDAINNKNHFGFLKISTRDHKTSDQYK